MRKSFVQVVGLVFSMAVVHTMHAAELRPLLPNPPQKPAQGKAWRPYPSTDPGKAPTSQTDARDSKERLQEKLNSIKKII